MEKQINIGLVVLAIVVVGLIIAGAIVLTNTHQEKTPRVIVEPAMPQEPVKIYSPPAVTKPVSQKLTPCSVFASSIAYDKVYPSGYQASFAIDGQLSTAWVEGSSGAGIGEWIQVDFRYPFTLTKIGIFPGYGRDRYRFYKNNRLQRARLLFSNNQSLTVWFGDLFGMAYFTLPSINSSFVRVVIEDVYPGWKYNDTCIAEIEVFGY